MLQYNPNTNYKNQLKPCQIDAKKITKYKHRQDMQGNKYHVSKTKQSSKTHPTFKDLVHRGH